MRRFLVILAAASVAGCGGGPPPDRATSERLVTEAVLEYHRLQAAGKGDAACELLTEKAQDEQVEADERAAEVTGFEAAEDCGETVESLAASPRARELLARTQVDAVEVDGERATVTAHTSGMIDGVMRVIPPARIQLTWHDGRWLIG